MKGSPRHASPAETDRGEDSRRIDAPRPADGELNIRNDSFLLLRRILVGNRPAGDFGRIPEGVPLGKGIDLHYGAVYIIGEIFAVVPDGTDGIPDLVSRPTDAVVLNRPDTLFMHEVIRRRVGSKCKPFHLLQVKDEHIEAAVGNDPRIELAQGTCGAVARVLKDLLPGRLCGSVRLLEILLRHIDFAADFEIIGNIAGKMLDNVRDDAGICCHVLPEFNPIPPRFRQDEIALLIAERHGETVNFVLDNKLRIRKLRQNFRYEGIHGLPGKDVLQGEHGNIVTDEDTGLPLGISAHMNRRRRRIIELRIFRLQPLQLFQQHIVFVVGNLRGVVVVVEPVVVFELAAQGLYAIFDFSFVRHDFFSSLTEKVCAEETPPRAIPPALNANRAQLPKLLP